MSRAFIAVHDDPKIVGSEIHEVIEYPQRWDIRDDLGHKRAIAVRIAGGRIVDTWTDRIGVRR